MSLVTWYVNGSKESSGDGKSDKNAFKTLSEALSASSTSETIMIASGTYFGSGNVGFTVNKNNLTIVGYGDGETVFDGQKTTRILTVNVTTINVDGLTFQNGAADYGGALYFNED